MMRTGLARGVSWIWRNVPVTFAGWSDLAWMPWWSAVNEKLDSFVYQPLEVTFWCWINFPREKKRVVQISWGLISDTFLYQQNCNLLIGSNDHAISVTCCSVVSTWHSCSCRDVTHQYWAKVNSTNIINDFLLYIFQTSALDWWIKIACDITVIVDGAHCKLSGTSSPAKPGPVPLPIDSQNWPTFTSPNFHLS